MNRSTCAAVAMLVVIQIGSVSYLAFHHGPTVNEPGHLVAGLRILTARKFDLYAVNPPLVKSLAAVPVILAGCEADWRRLETRAGSRSEDKVGRDFFAANGERAFLLLGLARCGCLPLVVVGSLVCFVWARTLYGTAGGFFAMALWVCSPTMLAHSSLITTDAAAAATGLLAAWTFWNWLRSPGPLKAFGASVALGLALLTKMTWIILLGLWPVLWALTSLSRRRRADALPSPTDRGGDESRVRIAALSQSDGESTRPRSGLVQLIVILAGALYFVNLGYGFNGSFRRLGDYQFFSQTLGASEFGRPGNSFRGHLPDSLPVPLPEDYVRGLDLQQRDFEVDRWNFMAGRNKLGGWWYYYLYAIAVKSPIAVFAIFLLSAVSAKRAGGARGLHELVLLAPCVCLLVAAGCKDSLNIGVRYVLPAYPFAFVWMGRCVAGRNVPAPREMLRYACLAAFVIESVCVYPHSLSFFNVLAGGPSQGHFHLIDSNTDWGQGLPELHAWLDRHPEVNRIHIAYFGGVDPRTAGMQCTVELPNYAGNPARKQTTWEPGWYAVSMNLLRGFDPILREKRVSFVATDRPIYAGFLRLQPVATVGYSIRIYHLTTCKPAAGPAREVVVREPGAPPSPDDDI